MRKSISTQELKTHIGEIVDAVRLRGDRYVIVRRGKPVAVLVPVSVNDAFERKRRELFTLMNGVSSRMATIPAKTIDDVIERAVSEVRSKKSKRE